MALGIQLFILISIMFVIEMAGIVKRQGGGGGGGRFGV